MIFGLHKKNFSQEQAYLDKAEGFYNEFPENQVLQ